MGRFRAAACVILITACGGASQSKVHGLGGTLSVSPATLDFGDVALGKQLTHELVLRNTGLVPMTVNNLPQFANPSFEVTGLPATLGPGSSANVTVRYRPPGLGPHERMLQLVTDSPADNGTDVDLRGNAVRGLATLSGDAFDFGNVVVGSTATQGLLLTNNDGKAETSIAISPPQDAPAFSVAPPDMLTGKGVDKLLLVQPETIDFGELLLGGNATKTFTVTNTSKAPLAVKTLTLSGSPDLTAALDGGALPRTLGPGETVAGTARYQPRNLGLQQAQASLQAVEGGPGILSMSGAGTGPWLQMKPKSLFVGPAAIGTTRTSTVTATNVGYDPARAAPLALTAVYLGKNDGTWSVQSGARSVGAPGASVDIAVSFSPATPGFSQATLVIESNDALHPRVEVPLSAIGRDL